MGVLMVQDSTDVLCTAGKQSLVLTLFPFHPSHYPPAIFASSIFPCQVVFLPLPLSLHSLPFLSPPFFALRLFFPHCPSFLFLPLPLFSTPLFLNTVFIFPLPLPLFLPVCSPLLPPFPSFLRPLLFPLSLILISPHNTSPSHGSVLKAVTFSPIVVDLNHFEPFETLKITASLRVLRFQ